jgi:hypothetical protein
MLVLLQIAKMVMKYHQDKEQREVRAEKEEGLKLRRIASNIAKMVKEFWSNIEKVKTARCCVALLLSFIYHFYVHLLLTVSFPTCRFNLLLLALDE